MFVPGLNPVWRQNGSETSSEHLILQRSPLRGGARGGGASCESVATAPWAPSRHPHTQPSPRKEERTQAGKLAAMRFMAGLGRARIAFQIAGPSP